jgi:hypothetical protein
MRSNNSFRSRITSFLTACFLIFAMTLAATMTGMPNTPHTPNTAADPAVAVAASSAPVPFPGPAPKNVPATIEIENFDRGGEGAGYHDISGIAGSGLYRNRPVEGVDIQAFSGASGGFVVTEAAAGEWLSYTIFNEVAGIYELSVRYASEFRAGTFHIEIDGRNATGMMTVAPTGTGFRSLFKKVELTAGQHTLRLVMDGNSPGSAGVCEFDSIAFRALKTQASSTAKANMLSETIASFSATSSVTHTFRGLLK